MELGLMELGLMELGLIDLGPIETGLIAAGRCSGLITHGRAASGADGPCVAVVCKAARVAPHVWQI
jgi:hypothetical protein